MNLSATRPKVVIIGSGFGGLFAAQSLAKADVDIRLIARTTHHLFQPLLYQVATGILSPGSIAPATREILARQKNAQVELGDVTEIDVAAKTVTATTLGMPRTFSYDYLIVAAGAAQSWFGNDHFAEYAPGMKSIDDALELRGRIFGAFELAEVAAAEGHPEEAKALTTFVVVGAGPTGVEMAGQLAELSHRTLKRDFRHIDPRKSTIYLMDAAGAVLGSFDESLQAKTRDAMEKLGVQVLLNAKVVDVDASGIAYEDTAGQTHRIDAVTKVWAAGVAASPLARQLADQVGLEVDRAGRIPVQPDLTLPGHPEVFVVGDMMTLDRLPGVAQVAIQQARYAASKIKAALGDKPVTEPFSYFNKGNMATISRFRAITEIGKIKVTGFVAWVLWLVVHLVYITGFKGRVTTLLHWLVSFIGRGRSERNITEQQVFGRLAMDRVNDLPSRAARKLGIKREDH